MTIPEILLRKIRNGNVVLFLGAGVNFGCTDSNGNKAPLGDDLSKLIKQHFFPNEDVPTDLENLSMVVESSYSKPELEDFIYKQFVDLKPNNDVLIWIPSFRWRRVYTTNFDRLLEQVYNETPERMQNLRPIYSNLDLIDYTLGPDLPYVKLHGCITRIKSKDTPLILTPESYANYETNRNKLFNRLQEDLQDNVILFIGYSLLDSNFQRIFYQLRNGVDINFFPRCYAIYPNAQKAVMDSWQLKKVDILDMTGEEFFKELRNSNINPSPSLVIPENEITDIAKESSGKFSFEAATELFRSFELVDEKIGYEDRDYVSFYRGNKPSWSIIRNEDDAKRTFYDQIMEQSLLKDEATRIQRFDLVVITAEAGAGKTTFLMRLAYDLATLFEGLCLFHLSRREMPISALEELHRYKKKRIYIFIDDLADNVVALAVLIKQAKTLDLPITVVGAERKNEWNNIIDRLSFTFPVEYELPYLDNVEIENILQVLERNSYLCELEQLSKDERKQVFRDKSQQQLLVAMREATEGKTFDEIIENEYDGIPNQNTQQVYLFICSLYRFGIAVRAGLLRRLAGVNFTQFEELLNHAERVIIEEYDPNLDEYFYRARHSHIADMVSRYVLNDGQKIIQNYLNILSLMDLGYSSDLASFRQLVRNDEIINAMPSIQHRRLFYDKALVLSQQASMVYQHYGRMEMYEGNLDEAEDLIAEARRLEPNNEAYQHTYALLLARKSWTASTEALRDRYFQLSQDTLLKLMKSSPTSSYPYDAYAKNLMSKADEAGEDFRRKQDYLEEAHEKLFYALRVCQNKTVLQETIGRIFEKLGDLEEAKRYLYQSHMVNPSSKRTTLLLSKILMREKEYPEALAVINDTLKFEMHDETLNALAGQILLEYEPNNHNKIIKHLEKAFDKEYIDTNVNFSLAVEYFRIGKDQEAEEIFKGFRERTAFRQDKKSYYVTEFLLTENGEKNLYDGEIKNIYPRYGFISVDLLHRDIYFQTGNVGNLRPRMRVKFNIGFNLMGPIAQNIKLQA